MFRCKTDVTVKKIQADTVVLHTLQHKYFRIRIQGVDINEISSCTCECKTHSWGKFIVGKGMREYCLWLKFYLVMKTPPYY